MSTACKMWKPGELLEAALPCLDFSGHLYSIALSALRKARRLP